MLARLSPLFSIRFVKFCAVGASGVVVNLGFLALFAELLAVQANIASALAIEISINTNFVINELWTFRDRGRDGAGLGGRWARFQVVSLAGALIQWTVFVGFNLFFALILWDKSASELYLGQGASWFETYVVRPVIAPPAVGSLKYVSQLVGIGVATLWNYLVNFYWTWAERRAEVKDD